MSNETLQAVHDAIAAHIADVNEDDPEFLTEWVFVASAASSTDADQTAYYVYDSSIPGHHTLGLLAYGTIQIRSHFGPRDDD